MSDYGKTCLGRRPFQCSVLHFSDNAVRDLHFPTMVLPLFRECLALPVQLTLTSVPVAVAKAAVNKHPHKKNCKVWLSDMHFLDFRGVFSRMCWALRLQRFHESFAA